MTGFGSPCGACKFLRRKCVRGCVFAPYFCHEQGAAHFAAIHKVFGASNASKLLLQLPVSDRPEAALTISYEAQARLQDPVYGCVSHIFALQQQILTLEAQLASLKAQTARGFGNEDEFSEKLPRHRQGDSFLRPLGSDAATNPQLMPYPNDAVLSSQQCHHHHSSYVTDDGSSCAMANSLDVQDNAWRPACHDMEELLQSVAFGHLNCA
ncbi:LOB domain-containing protein CRL1-like [Musa acuminata AAA Group]|uniref:LOB domain-containing protein CRL1-like n=1 Tax=Musa acuminata AAA Group TaxID=214697 RepID=UPI0031E34907